MSTPSGDPGAAPTKPTIYVLGGGPSGLWILGYGFCRPNPPKTDGPMLGG